MPCLYITYALKNMALKSIKFIPVFSTILKQRLLCFLIIIIPPLILLAHMFDIYSHICLFYSVTKTPCPACGLTRSFNHAITGNWYTAIKLHLLIPILLIFWITILLITILPQKTRSVIISKIEIYEKKTGFFLWFLVIYFCYGIARISVQAYNLY